MADELITQLFEATQQQYRTLVRYKKLFGENDDLTLTARTHFCALYEFLQQAELEEDYIAWRYEQEKC